jgi:hypothetical protein
VLSDKIHDFEKANDRLLFEARQLKEDIEEANAQVRTNLSFFCSVFFLLKLLFCVHQSGAPTDD